jgi:DNA-binding transcriptional LysR family regulator
VLAGAGIGAIPGLIAHEDLAAGRLARILPDWTTQRRGLYFVYPSAHSVTARLRAFIDHLADALKGAG